MTKAYGKYPRRSSPKGPKPPDSLVVKIHGLYTLEQISHELQKVVAQLQDYGAYGVEDFRIYLKPVNNKAERIALHDPEGKPVETIEINAPEKKAFRDH